MTTGRVSIGALQLEPNPTEFGKQWSSDHSSDVYPGTDPSSTEYGVISGGSRVFTISGTCIHNKGGKTLQEWYDAIEALEGKSQQEVSLRYRDLAGFLDKTWTVVVDSIDVPLSVGKYGCFPYTIVCKEGTIP